MPDYNEHNLTPLDPLHHVEGLTGAVPLCPGAACSPRQTLPRMRT